LEVRPDFAQAHNNLGAVLLQSGRVAEAIVHHEQALRLKPDDAMAHLCLGTALFQLGKLPAAVGHYEQALRLKPDLAQARNQLGLALYQLGEAAAAASNWAEAIRQFQRAVALKSDHASAHDSLGLALSRVGRFAEAVAQYGQALALNPRLVSAQNNLAWLLATCPDASIRNGARAVELAEGANQLAGGKNPAVLDTLAAAYAEAGRFSEAIVTAKQAFELAMAAGRKELAGQAESRLKLYESGRPYHQQ
jgi:Flp pilus assembly protein TadD